MDEKKKHEELQSRRDFFKKAAKAALPIVGAIVLASGTNVMNAAENAVEMGCTGTCYGGCKNACTSCKYTCEDGCKNACTSCRYTCDGGCKNANR